MFEASLVSAVEQFAALTLAAPDSQLEREWTWGAYDSEGVRFAFFRTYEELRELVARMAAERSAQGPPVSTAQRILAQYHASYRDLQAALMGVDADAARREPAGGEWPVRKVVAHIVQADVGFYVVVRYALDRHHSGDGRPAEVPDQEWEVVAGQDGASVEAILEGPLEGIRTFHETLHERVLLEFSGITEDELALPSMYWEGSEMSLRFRLHRFDSHLRQHIVQIDKTLAAVGHPLNEARRLLRLVFAALAEAEGASIGAWGVGADLWRTTAETIAARAEEVAAVLV
jgi:hypothetical protein